MFLVTSVTKCPFQSFGQVNIDVGFFISSELFLGVLHSVTNYWTNRLL